MKKENNKQKQKNERIVIHVTSEEKDYLKELCNLYGFSISDFIRMAIRRNILLLSDS